MPAKKIFAALFIILVAVGGFVAGLYLLQQRQNIDSPAAVPTGDAKIYIKPETGTYAIGDSFDVVVSFNTQGIPIAGIEAQLVYPYSGTTPEVSVQRVTISSGLSAGDWTCPTQGNRTEDGNVIIEIGCANTSAYGFVSTAETQLATINLKAERQPLTSPVTIRFDPANSTIKTRTDNRDILLTPESSGTYVIGQSTQATATVAPTARLTGTGSITATKTPTPTRAVTTTASVTVSETSTTPTPTALPDTGFVSPTMIGAVFGGLVIMGAILLAI